jgi:hypothetical protein
MVTIEKIKISKGKKAILSNGNKVTLTGKTGVSTLGEWAECKDAKGNVDKVILSAILVVQTSLSSDWCSCGHEVFHSYPQDGECSCGIYKHHVHCATCGCVSQIG